MRLDERVLASKGRWLTVKFIKKTTGEERVMNCRIDVTKHLKGGQRASNPDEYIVVYEPVSKGYRHIGRDSILSVTDGGVTYT